MENKSIIDSFFGADAFKTPEPVYYDRSLLELTATCPLQAVLTKLHEAELDPMPELPQVGDIIHKLAEEAIKASEYNLQEAADYLTNELPKVRPDLQPEVLRAGRNLAFELVQFSARQVLLGEQQITRAILPATQAKGETLITTCPDLVLATNKADTILDLDYKTGFKRRSNQDAQDALQTCVISWCLFGKYPNVKTIHFFYLETRLKNRAYACIERDSIVGGAKEQPLTQEQAFQSRIFETVRIIESKTDEAWPVEEKCSACRVSRWCKYATGDIGEFAKNEKAYLDTYNVLLGRIGKMESVLNEAVKAGRIIISSTGTYDDTPKKKSPLKCSFKEFKKIIATRDKMAGENEMINRMYYRAARGVPVLSCQPE